MNHMTDRKSIPHPQYTALRPGSELKHQESSESLSEESPVVHGDLLESAEVAHKPVPSPSPTSVAPSSPGVDGHGFSPRSTQRRPLTPSSMASRPRSEPTFEQDVEKQQSSLEHIYENVGQFAATTQLLLSGAKHDGGLNMMKRAGELSVVPVYAATIAAGAPLHGLGLIVGPLVGAAVLFGISLFASVFRNRRRQAFLADPDVAAGVTAFKASFKEMEKHVKTIGEDALRQDQDPQFKKFYRQWQDAKRLHAYVDYDPTKTGKNIWDGVKEGFLGFGSAHVRFFNGISKATAGVDLVDRFKDMRAAALEQANQQRAADQEDGEDYRPYTDDDVVPQREEEERAGEAAWAERRDFSAREPVLSEKKGPNVDVSEYHSFDDEDDEKAEQGRYERTSNPRIEELIENERAR